MKNTHTKIAYILLLALFSCNTFATNTVDEEEILTVVDPGVDPGGTPIDSYILPMLLLGIFVGYQLTRKKYNPIKYK
ncbi:MAG: hypothetical protein RL308_1197 [Bacteroidota bacterium]|jgi:hypothetical protein